MSNYLEITPDGLKHYDLNTEKNRQYKIKKFPESYKACVIDRKTKEQVFEGTEKEVDRFFYDETPIEGVWSKLRSTCHIHKDATLGDFYRIIDDDPTLQFLIQCFFPFHDTMEICSNEASPKEIVVSRKAELNHDHMRWTSAVDGIVSPDNSGSKLIFTETIPVFLNGKQVGEGKNTWSFLEILDALMGAGAPRESVKIKKDKFETSAGETESIMAWAMGPATIDPDVTLQDIFNLVDKDELLKTFLSEYSWCHAIDEIHAAAQPHSPSESITEIHVYDRSRLTNAGYFDIGAEISGIGPIDEDAAKAYENSTSPLPEFETYSVSATPIAEIAPLPVKVVNGYTFLQNLNKKISHSRDFTLLEILDAIYWEISFYGSPADAAEMLQEMGEVVNTIKLEETVQ